MNKYIFTILHVNKSHACDCVKASESSIGLDRGRTMCDFRCFRTQLHIQYSCVHSKTYTMLLFAYFSSCFYSWMLFLCVFFSFFLFYVCRVCMFCWYEEIRINYQSYSLLRQFTYTHTHKHIHICVRMLGRTQTHARTPMRSLTWLHVHVAIAATHFRVNWYTQGMGQEWIYSNSTHICPMHTNVKCI